jgi:hypothetical protein
MLAQVLTLLFLRRLELHNSAAEAAVVAAAESSEVFDLHATAAERRPAPSAEALPVTDVEGGGSGGGGGGGECFLRVPWVAVPEALRARRVNSRRWWRGGRAGAAGGSGGRTGRYAGCGAAAGGQAVGWWCRGARLSNPCTRRSDARMAWSET